MWRLCLHERALRERAGYQAVMFGTFSLFWTTVPLLLTSDVFGLTQKGVAFFALAGVAGAIAAPLAGRIADRGWITSATLAAMALAIVAFFITILASLGSILSLALFVAAAVMLDFAVAMNLVIGQRVLFALAPEIRGRLNGLYMAIFFCGGALGSAAGSYLFTRYAWVGAAGVAIGAIAGVMAVALCKGLKR